MRLHVWAALAAAFAIAACTDSPAPTALNSTDGGPAVAPEAHFSGGHGLNEPAPSAKKPDHCQDNDHGRDHDRFFRHLIKRGRYFYYYDRHHHLVRWDPPAKPKGECPDSSGGGQDQPGSVSGTVMNNGAGAVGFPVFLLSTDGATVVATTNTTSDGTGAFSFAGVKAGSYLLCETNPFTDQWGMLGETRPNSGPACPAAYAPLGFTVTVTAGTASTGFAFSNMQLD